jgi:hypothetical protein
MFVNVYTVNILLFLLPSGDRLCARIDSDEKKAASKMAIPASITAERLKRPCN